MKKLITFSTKDALLINFVLSDFASRSSVILSNSDDYPSEVIEQVLDDLDRCDSIRRKLLKVFDFSNID